MTASITKSRPAFLGDAEQGVTILFTLPRTQLVDGEPRVVFADGKPVYDNHLGEIATYERVNNGNHPAIAFTLTCSDREFRCRPDMNVEILTGDDERDAVLDGVEQEDVLIGQGDMPYKERDPQTKRPVPGTFPVYRAHAPWGKVGQLWWNPRTKKYLAHRVGFGVLLHGDRDTKQAAAAAVGWTVLDRNNKEN